MGGSKLGLTSFNLQLIDECVCLFVCFNERDDKIRVLPLTPPAVGVSVIELLADQMMGKWVEKKFLLNWQHLALNREGELYKLIWEILFLNLHTFFQQGTKKLEKKGGGGKPK